MSSGYTAISASAARVDLDTLFKPRTSTAIADTGFKVGGVDLADRYEPSAAEADRIAFNVYYKKGVADISTLFMDINWADMLQYMLHVISGSGTGMKNSGSLAPISASIIPHHTFNIWVGDGITDVNSANTTVLMDAEKWVTASFNISQYTLTVNNGSGTDTQNYGWTYPITASVPANKYFVNWTSPQSPTFVIGTSTDAEAAVTISENTSITGNTAWDQYTLTVTYGSGDGTYDYNASMAIVAQSPPSYQVFNNWINPVGSLSFDSTTAASTNAHFTSPGNATAEATFAWEDYTITIQKDAGITSTSPTVGAHTYQYPDFPVNVSCTVEWDYDFAHWELDSVNVGGSAGSYDITGIGNHTLKATSVLKNVAFTITDDGNGTADSATSSPCPIHTVVTVNTYPDTGYSFDYLSANNSGQVSGYTVQLEGLGTTTITAHFQINQYTLTVTYGTGGGLQNYGYQYNIAAGSYTGFTFSNWAHTGGNTVSFGNSTSANTTCDIVGAGNATVEAMYNANSYTLSVTNGSGGGAADYEDPSGHQYSITANSVPTGYSWGGWETNSGTVSYADQNAMNTTCYIGAANADITATYDINQYTLTVVWGTGGGSANYGNTYNIVATDYEPAYTFTNWQVNSGNASFGSSTSMSTTCTIGAANAEVEAIYVQN